MQADGGSRQCCPDEGAHSRALQSFVSTSPAMATGLAAPGRRELRTQRHKLGRDHLGGGQSPRSRPVRERKGTQTATVLRAACCVLRGAWCVLRATCYVLRATCYVLRDAITVPL